MKGTAHITGRLSSRPAATLATAFVLALIAFASSLALPLFAPSQAWADPGDILGYAYLDLDEKGDPTALVVQATRRDDSSAYVELPVWKEGGLRPWGDRCAEIRTARFESLATNPTGTTLLYLFGDCTKLESIDFNGLDTSNVTSMAGLFYNCSSLTSIEGLSVLNTSNVTTMGAMFEGCSSLASLDLSNFDTSGVESMSSMFEGCSSLVSVNLTKFNTSSVSSLSRMFYGCSSLASLDLSNFDTSGVKSMSSMFEGCSSLVSVNLTKFNTSSVSSLSRMFYGCTKLVSINLSNFDTSNVTDMGGMLNGCSALVSVDFSGFNTSRVTSMTNLFSGCTRLNWLLVEKPFTFVGSTGFPIGSTSQWFSMSNPSTLLETTEQLSSVIAASSEGQIAFSRYYSPDSGMSLNGTSGKCAWTIENGVLVISPLDGVNDEEKGLLGNCGDPDYASWRQSGDLFTSVQFNKGVRAQSSCKELFSGCHNVRTIDFGGFDMAQVVDAQSMFANCTALYFVDMTDVAAPNVQNVGAMFAGCNSLESIDLSFLSEARLSSAVGMFRDCTSLVSIDLSRINTSNVEDMQYMFAGCSSLKAVDLTKLDTAKVAKMDYMFSTTMYGNSCSSLVSVNLSDVNTANLTSITHMFAGCSALQSLDLSKFDISSVTTMGGLFYGCASLKTLDLSKLNTSNVVNMSDLLYDCSSLTSINLSNLDTSNVVQIGGMFHGCSSLGAIDVSSLETGKARSMFGMFHSCCSLKAIDVSSFSSSSLQDARYMFYDCRLLENLDLSWLSFPDGFGSSFAEKIIDDCDSLQSVRLGAGAPSVSLPGGYWVSDADNALYKTSKANVDATYRRLARQENVFGYYPYATLDENGTMSLAFGRPETITGSVYWISEYGYTSPEEVPWHNECGRIKSVICRQSLAFNFKSLSYWFAGCNALGQVDLSDLRLNYVIEAKSLFDGCSSLVNVDFGERLAGDRLPAADYSGMFRGCSSLGALDLSAISTTRATSMRRMFHGCSSLENVTFGDNFTFRGMTTSRLPGGELPDGAWASSAEPGRAYLSNSIPMGAATYTKLTGAQLDDPGLQVVSTRGETPAGKPQLEASSTIDENGDEVVSYAVDEDYPSETLYLGESPRSMATAKLNTATVKRSTVVGKVKSPSTTRAIVGSKVKTIKPYAFSESPSIRYLTVKSPKLTSSARVGSALAGSRVVSVNVTSMSRAKCLKVKSAFDNYAWKE